MSRFFIKQISVTGEKVLFSEVSCTTSFDFRFTNTVLKGEKTQNYRERKSHTWNAGIPVQIYCKSLRKQSGDYCRK